MAQLGTVTVTGYAGSNPTEFGKDGGPPACSFRLGCTRGYYDADHVWHTLPTTWLTIKVFRRLAANVCQSIRKGDPVFVTGRLATEEWTQQGENRSRLVVEAASVGHDLNGGVTVLRRLQKPSEPQQSAQTHTVGSGEAAANGDGVAVGGGGVALPTGAADDVGGMGAATHAVTHDMANGMVNNARMHDAAALDNHANTVAGIDPFDEGPAF